MNNEIVKIKDFDVNVIPKIVEANKYDYTKYFVGFGAISILFIPHIFTTLISIKILSTIGGIGIGYYFYNEIDYQKIISNMKEEYRSINLIEDNLLIYQKIYKILTNSNNSIGNLNHKYCELYPEYDNKIDLLKLHIHQIKLLFQYVFNLKEESTFINEHINLCIENCIYQQNYKYIINIINKMMFDKNEQFLKNKYNPIFQKKIKESCLSYKINYEICVNLLNTLELTMTASEKIDVLSIVCNEINDQYHKEIPSDILLDVLTYVIILSNIDRPYDHINYMNEYMTDINGKNGYLLVTFNAAVDFISRGE